MKIRFLSGCTSRWVILALASLYSGAAHAQTIDYTPADLTLGQDGAPEGFRFTAASPPLQKVPPTGATAEVRDAIGKAVSACKLVVDGTANQARVTSSSPGDCAALWRAKDLFRGSIHFSWPGDTAGAVLAISPVSVTVGLERKVKVPHVDGDSWNVAQSEVFGAAAAAQFIFVPSMGWTEAESNASGRVELSEAFAPSASQQIDFRVFRKVSADNYEMFDVKLTAVPPHDAETPQRADLWLRCRSGTAAAACVRQLF